MEALGARPGLAAGERALVFVGFMGAGKTSAARAVAAELGVESIDADRELEAELGETIEAFFDREGEAAFREREEALVLRLLEAPPGPVLALGGGALGSEQVREALVAHTVVHLEVTPEDAWHRASGKGRPLARDRTRFDQLHADRAAIYAAAAHATLPPGGRDVVRRALPALRALADAPEGTRMVWATSASGDYPVFFGRGLLAAGFLFPQDGRRFVVSDEHVGRHHVVPGAPPGAAAVPLGDSSPSSRGDASASSSGSFLLAPGERHKTLANVEAVLRWLAQTGAERGDVVVALGGGVVGDLAGFAAATYQRGMRYVQVPTTLVAQVDSAYGGKTGVDLPEGKNYAGAYHQPAAVICDPSTLDTLPPEELAAGYAEVVKTALIAGGPLWARVRQGGAVEDEVILGCLRTKLATVAEDERDGGRRQVLNLGHTVGHAIESATSYARYRHGEAIAIGLLAALRLSGRDALRDEVAALFAAQGLPQTFSGASVDEVVALIARDKKRSGGKVPFVLVQAPGEVTPGHEVESAALRAAVEEVAA